MNRKAIIAGSAPISDALREADLSGYHKLALNHAWRLRPDFDYHLFLANLPEEKRPPQDYKIERLGRNIFSTSVNKAGGAYLASMTAATSAGYWMIYNLKVNVVSYFGCDMAYDRKAVNHFYGEGGDKGPMLQKFIHNSNYPEKYARLFIYGLLNRTLIINGSGQAGTQLSLPIVPLGHEVPELRDWVMKHPRAQAILRRGVEALIAETNLRTSVFDERVLIFNKSDEAKEIIEEVNMIWAPIANMLIEFSPVVRAMALQKNPDPDL